MGDRLREWHWPIPHELLVFGSNGQGDQLGLWYPLEADPTGRTPVLMVGGVFEPACMALVGTSLARFLRAWSGYYLLLDDAPDEALDAIGLPDRLRQLDDVAGLAPYFAWADPDLPDYDPDPYSKGMTIEQIVALMS